MRSRASPTWSPGKAASSGPNRSAMSNPSRSTSFAASGSETTTRSRSECSSTSPVMNEPPAATPSRRASAWSIGSARSRKARCLGGSSGQCPGSRTYSAISLTSRRRIVAFCTPVTSRVDQGYDHFSGKAQSYNIPGTPRSRVRFRSFNLQRAESHLTRTLFRQIVARIHDPRGTQENDGQHPFSGQLIS